MKRTIFTLAILTLTMTTNCSSAQEQEQFYDLSYIPIHSESGNSYTYFDLSTEAKVKGIKNYDWADYFHDGIAIVADKLEDNDYKFYFINSEFKPISNEKYDRVTVFNNGYAWAAQINGPITAIRQDGTTAFTLPDAEIAYSFNDNVAVFRSRAGYGLVNTSGDVLIKPGQFEKLGPLGYNKMIKAAININDGPLKYGIIRYDGTEIIPFEFDDIKFSATTARNKAFPVENNWNWGVVNIKNEETIAPIYNEIRPQNNGNYIGIRHDYRRDFHEVTYISNTGAELIHPSFRDIGDFTYGNHTCARREHEDLYGIIDETGKIIISPRFDHIYDFDDNELAIFERDEKYGVLDLNGNIIIPNKYDSLDYIGKGLYMASLDRNYGLINSNGKTIINFSGDYSPVEAQDELYICYNY